MPQDVIETINTSPKMIDRGAISSIIDLVGGPVKIFLPNYTADMQGDTRANYMTEPIHEIALIRSRTDTTILREQGLEFQGDALGYFKYDSKIVPEAEVWVQRDPIERTTLVYYVVSTQTSQFENERKFVKAVMQKRRSEPVTE